MASVFSLRRSLQPVHVWFLLAALVIVSAPAIAQDAAQNMILNPTPRILPDIRFDDGEMRAVSLADFRGKVVLLNIWATWCGPCRRELPTLDRLQSQLGGPDFEVVALSIDRTGLEAVREFYREVGVKHLAMYIDRSGRASRDLGVVGLPTTLLIDRAGRELGRLIGPAEWDGPEMVAFVRKHLAGLVKNLKVADDPERTFVGLCDSAGGSRKLGVSATPSRIPVRRRGWQCDRCQSWRVLASLDRDQCPL